MLRYQIFTTTAFGGTANALIWAADHGATIAQNSWGYGDSLVYNQSDLDAIDYFNVHGGGEALKGGVAFFSAGNKGLEGTYYPGCYSGAFSVAASDNKDTRAVYSNHGTWVDITAPGGDKASVGVLSTSTGGDYKELDGTSMACPHVSGTAALVLSAAYRNGVVLTADQLKEIIQKSADDIFDAPLKSTMGAGRVNAGKAIALLNSTYLSTLQPPHFFSAEVRSYSSVALAWSNSEKESVLITATKGAVPSSPVKGTQYAVGDRIGNSVVVYRGNDSAAVHSELTAGDTVRYSIYSLSKTFDYSGARECSAVTDHFSSVGTAEDPYVINSLSDLRIVSEYPRYWDNHIRLNKSINCSETATWNDGAGWNPIGDEFVPFSGTFHGNGHKIDSLFIDRGSDYCSFFGYINGGSVDSLGIVNARISGGGFTAGFVGKLAGTANACFATGTVKGKNFAGGFAGLLNPATVNNCYSQVAVKGNMYVGGFAGSCYNTKIKNSYCVGSVTAETPSSGGGFAGTGDADISCFWNSEIATVTSSKGGIAKSSSEMKMVSTYAGWDFASLWELPANGYPAFSWDRDSIPTPILSKSTLLAGTQGILIPNNPVNSADRSCPLMVKTDSPAVVEFLIYDALGSVVNRSEPIDTKQGVASYEWSLTNLQGAAIASGIYAVRAKVQFHNGDVAVDEDQIGVYVNRNK